jgi:hypothetical protein
LLLDPPPQITKPKRHALSDLKIGSPSMLTASRWQKRHSTCVRTKFCPRGPPGTFILPSSAPATTSEAENQSHMPNAWSSPAESGWDNEPYIVVGVMGIHHDIPKERLLTVKKPETLFQQIRKASWTVRPWYRHLFSLKTIAAFGIYECNPVRGYHEQVELDKQTSRILSEMFVDYLSGDPDYGDRWLRWVQKELNQGNLNPADGRYALSLVLKWAPFKVTFYGTASIIFSLVIGFWYQWKGGQFPGAGRSDMVGIVQTAWTISSYILTAAGGKYPRLSLMEMIKNSQLTTFSCHCVTGGCHPDWRCVT